MSNDSKNFTLEEKTKIALGGRIRGSRHDD